MHLFWWQQLPLLILIQLLEPNSISYKLCVEALVASKSTICTPQHSTGRIGRYPCLRQWASANCNKLNDPGVVSLSPSRRHLLFLKSGFVKLSSSNFISSPIELQERLHKARNRRIAAEVGRDNGVPTLTPLQPANDKKSSKQKFAAIIAGAGAALLVIVIVALVYMCLMRIKKVLRHRSETASSMPSSPSDLARGNIFPYAAAQSPFNARDLRQLSIVEVEHATHNFSQSNIIGEGSFGFAYKGLLLDGSIVAIKRCLHKPVQDFVHEVKHIASVHHKHLVDLIGYCEDTHQKFLVYDYISNGNVGSYLYDSEGLPIGKLDMRQRLSIALGAAKGLQYLHSMVPPLLHMHFRSSNVLLGDNIIAKVSDYGLLKLAMESHRAGTSSAIDYFLDPELSLSKNFSERSDVYSFGVFLLELISGHEARGRYMSISGHNLIQESRECNLENFIDRTLGERTIQAAKPLMELALQCIDVSMKRPSMTRIVQEIEQIQGREIRYSQAEFDEEIGSVTLGSELFK
ncbi:probable serine/threonine-protein kinase PBL28 isoform X1 [Ricinus communis]|uniref:probable serine/threonine-protein kinase PBL28 isoform X1 n=1 Tax=Ricinus communis TaxID=3988 RepID=UPI000772922B|nr:probable serine/threonine-protein kinase PBL28 isoform X1 [Ricinus communis]XP_015581547.1 probable serine/threonine-protein kinase PBL28 isoform X1 [Ricinus communis]XP_015581548.1 probable serine/threonine-protein kinase PBL28 isoform X1 [Ricinus communis]XP_025015086.1 probable serine/threonine-protein kinase PBL28 isoform X1 [Ricinus communis]XP_048234631.1 probable serine/threonine-protein kinase PBL28 isoform X1 [Ricinus communis]XP_048234632.1 probable serine/threonine-protein kinase|eukprot:XP_015581542.1 probable serine/threonine-protein kinase PBL28 isoform X1 [Ricinus communis]